MHALESIVALEEMRERRYFLDIARKMSEKGILDVKKFHEDLNMDMETGFYFSFNDVNWSGPYPTRELAFEDAGKEYLGR